MKKYKLLLIASALTVIAFVQVACSGTSPGSWPPTPDTHKLEQVQPTWTASPLSPDASPTPTPTPTMTPAVPPEPLLSPTPDYPSIALTLQPVVSGQGVTSAALYDPNGPGPHPLVLLSTSGAAYTQEIKEESIGGNQWTTIDDWNPQLPYDWSPASLNEVELVVVIGDEREYELESAGYVSSSGQGFTMTAYRYETDIELREARTGKTLATFPYRGSDPRPFPDNWREETFRLEGSHLTYVDLEAWLCPLITPQGCWKPQPPTEGQDLSITNAVFSPDGQMIASSDDNANTMHLWQTSDGALLRTLEGPDSGISTLVFSPDGQTLASGSYNSPSIHLWRVSDGSLLQTLDGKTDHVYILEFSPDGQTLVSESISDGSTGPQVKSIRLWRVSDGALLRTLEGQTEWNWETSVAFSPDGQTLVLIADSITLQLWQTSDGALLSTLEGHTERINRVVFSPDGQSLASGSNDTSVRLWRVSDYSLLRVLEGLSTDWVDSVAFSPDGQTLIAQRDYGNTVQLWRVSDGKLLQTLKGQTHLMGREVFSPNGETLASWGYNSVQLWRVSDGVLVRTLDGAEDCWVNSVAFSPDGQTLVSVASSGAASEADTETTVQLWRVSDGFLLRTLLVMKGTSRVTAAFSPAGETLLININNFGTLWKVQ